MDPVSATRQWRQRKMARRDERQGRALQLANERTLMASSQVPGGGAAASVMQVLSQLPEPTADDIGRIVHVRNDSSPDTFNIGVTQPDGTVIWTPLNIEVPDTTRAWIAAFQASFATFVYGIAVDASGNLWVANATTNYVRKYDNAGNYLGVQVGGTGSGNGQLNGPRGIGCDSAGNLYVCDSGNQRVQKFSSTGTYLLQFGSLGTGDGQFNAPRCLAFDFNGTSLYVTDANNHRVQQFTVSGTTATYTAKFGTYGTNNGQFNQPYGVAVGSDGTVFVADQNNSRVQAFTASLTFVNRFGSYGTALGQFKSLSYLACDAFGNVWTIDYQRMQRWTIAGATTLGAYTQFDDFNGGNTSSGSIGELGWTAAGNGSTSTLASTAAHAGIIRLASGGTSGNSQRLTFGPFLFDQLAETQYLFRPSDGSGASVFYRVGLTDSPTSPAHGLYAEVDSASTDTTWKSVRMVSGVATRTDTTLPWTANVWYRLTLTWTGSGSANLIIRRMDTGQELTVAQSGVNTAAQLYLTFIVQTRSGTAKQLDVDAAILTTQNITRV